MKISNALKRFFMIHKVFFLPVLTTIFSVILFSCSEKEDSKDYSAIVYERSNPDSLGLIINWKHNPTVYTDAEVLPPLVLCHGLGRDAAINRERIDPFSVLEPCKIQFKVEFLYQYLELISDGELSPEDAREIVELSREKTSSWTTDSVYITNNLFDVKDKDGSLKRYTHWTDSVEDFLFNYWFEEL